MSDVPSNFDFVFGLIYIDILQWLTVSELCHMLLCTPSIKKQVETFIPIYKNIMKRECCIKPMPKTLENMILKNYVSNSMDVVVELEYIFSTSKYKKVFSVSQDEKVAEVIPRLYIDDVTFRSLLMKDTIFGIPLLRMTKTFEFDDHFNFELEISMEGDKLGTCEVVMHMNSSWCDLLNTISMEYNIPCRNANITFFYNSTTTIAHIMTFVDFDTSFLLNNLTPIDFKNCEEIRPESISITYFSMSVNEDHGNHDIVSREDMVIHVDPRKEYILFT